jgi:hypothetical protein
MDPARRSSPLDQIQHNAIIAGDMTTLNTIKGQSSSILTKNPSLVNQSLSFHGAMAALVPLSDELLDLSNGAAGCDDGAAIAAADFEAGRRGESNDEFEEAAAAAAAAIFRGGDSSHGDRLLVCEFSDAIASLLL